MTDLRGRAAIVTGSSSGIGEAIARHLSLAGCHVIVNSVQSVERGRAVAGSLPTESAYVQADISDQAQCRRLVGEAIARFGRLDLLVNNAAWTSRVDHSDLEGLSDEILRRTFEVNVYGTWWLTRAAMPQLRKSPDGNVVMITSLAGLRPFGSSIAYCMSKAALHQLTRVLARSCAPVRVNAVAPGVIATPWLEDFEGVHTALVRRAPLKRIGSPDEIARSVTGLVTSSYTTGAILVVDGGLSQVM
jgi:ketoreductase RED2